MLRAQKINRASVEALLAGLWVFIGFNPIVKISELPLREIAEVTETSTYTAIPGPEQWIFVIHVLVAIGFLHSLFTSLRFGKIPGLVAFGSSFLAGIVFFNSIQTGIVLVFISVFSAILADIIYEPVDRGRGGQPPRHYSGPP